MQQKQWRTFTPYLYMPAYVGRVYELAVLVIRPLVFQRLPGHGWVQRVQHDGFRIFMTNAQIASRLQVAAMLHRALLNNVLASHWLALGHGRLVARLYQSIRM